MFLFANRGALIFSPDYSRPLDAILTPSFLSNHALILPFISKAIAVVMAAPTKEVTMQAAENTKSQSSRFISLLGVCFWG
jgi:hypothetical protein